MNTFLATFVILGIVIIIMSVGVLVAGRRIKGSCGGLNSIEGLEDACMTCSKPCDKKKKALEQLKQQDEFEMTFKSDHK